MGDWDVPVNSISIESVQLPPYRQQRPKHAHEQGSPVTTMWINTGGNGRLPAELDSNSGRRMKVEIGATGAVSVQLTTGRDNATLGRDGYIGLGYNQSQMQDNLELFLEGVNNLLPQPGGSLQASGTLLPTQQ